MLAFLMENVKQWLDSLSRSMNVYPQGKFEDAYKTVIALRDAGVDILAGSDVSEPIPILYIRHVIDPFRVASRRNITLGRRCTKRALPTLDLEFGIT